MPPALQPGALTAQQEVAVFRVVQGKSTAEIAGELGISPETVRAWKALPGFQPYLESVRREIRKGLVKETVEALAMLQPLAVRTLHRAMVYGAKNPKALKAAVGAAREVLDRHAETSRVARTEERRVTRVVMTEEVADRIQRALGT